MKNWVTCGDRIINLDNVVCVLFRHGGGVELTVIGSSPIELTREDAEELDRRFGYKYV